MSASCAVPSIVRGAQCPLGFSRKTKPYQNSGDRSLDVAKLCCVPHCERRLSAHSVFSQTKLFQNSGNWPMGVTKMCCACSQTLTHTQHNILLKVEQNGRPAWTEDESRRGGGGSRPTGTGGSLHQGSGCRLCLRRRSRRGANAGAPQEKACRSSPCRLWQELQVKRWTPPRSPSSSLRC